jgi:N-acetylglucosamine-6-phosphate deacetylase
MAVAAKHPSRVMAVTDGTAGAGLSPGSRARLGGHAITVGPAAAHLDDGTLAGSICTMDRAFRVLVGEAGLSLVDAAHVSSTTPARELGLHGHGVIAPGALADLVVLGPDLDVRQTWVEGTLAYSAASREGE